MTKVSIKDTIELDGKKAISTRDGFQEYVGNEIGMDDNKIYKVYRSPATIAKLQNSLNGIHLTREHIEHNKNPQDFSIGTIASTEIIDCIKDDIDSKLALQHIIKINDGVTLDNKELSLGYDADLMGHYKYDFEMRNVKPHHLAVVSDGRCGDTCKFLDNKTGDKMSEEVKKDDEAMSLDELIDLISRLPDIIKTLDPEGLAQVTEQLKPIIEMTKTEETVPDKEPDEEEQKDEEPNEEDKEEEAKKISDSVNKAVKYHLQVVNKARLFLDDSYDFTKDTNTIIRAVLANEYPDQSFADSELGLALKMLKKPTVDYRNFADGSNTLTLEQELDKIGDK